MNSTASLSANNLTNQASSPTSALWLALLATEAGWGATLARLALAPVMFAHGLQKAFGLFGGYGWSGTMGFLTQKIGLPAPLAAAMIVFELVGPVALVVGFGTRVAALGVVAIMLGAVATVHFPYGFYMNWSGTQAGEGYEFHLLALGLAGVLVLGGAGRASLDRLLARR